MDGTEAEEKIMKIKAERIRLQTLTQFLLMVKSQKQREKGNKLNKPLSVRFCNSKMFKLGKDSSESKKKDKKEDKDVDRQAVKTVLKNETQKKAIDACDLAKQFKWPYDKASQDWNPKNGNINE